ncbi:MAG: bifunctional phosphoribosylaminoimidazolecarboxamide formyltransferase/IMP cyclohydrolase [Kofleriaceae bacterium]|nr:bifunctional phosphoribosylaminoimidazolecarboxamide formyltransferase/IMP cyclohydrolase [Myxococcales bacterium]MCB9563548.1 bifunctional phosphoribosylaminoimidazolecarboxamide formyltransferase/IMP cyclohydrolase [Kofleriaceae bacterium]MCB9574960.1 bifunctional phosphoribosylaminoimidazolecarboxamide formyltransferase/IMP cyclohydrolase [Kofleriaceae bacterium]
MSQDSRTPGIRRALLSVSDKRGLVDLARVLIDLGVEILSTGGTAKALADAGLPVVQVSAHTGAPEILEGRVKTLHPRIHGGLLGRPTPAHEAEMAAHDIAPIDLVVVNLYPFEATVAKPDVALADAIENIDIGGPSMLRSAAKNHERVAVVVDPDDYGAIAEELRAGGGALTAPRRLALARKAFAHTAAYDAAIAAYLGAIEDAAADARDAAPARRELSDVVGVQWRRLYDLRYGENPHQRAAFYADGRSPLPGWPADRPTIAGAEVLGGKQLSYNNILDLDAALGLCLEFAAPTAVVVKHNNPCGVASGDDLAATYVRAREADPVSAFGGIVAINREVDDDLARLLVETFLECVVAPGYSEAARGILAAKKNLRLVAAGGDWTPRAGDTAWTVRTVSGGVLIQTADTGMIDAAAAKVVTRRAPTAAELADLDFAWRVGKHVKSNAIVFCKDRATVGVGAGQMSRVDSARIAGLKARSPLAGTVAASDAFFPFRDGVDVLAEAGATAVIQPGGSIRDEEVIAAADEHGLAMVVTGMRHFRH